MGGRRREDARHGCRAGSAAGASRVAGRVGAAGSIYLYQGEELGLPEVADLPPDVLQDPIAVRSGGADVAERAAGAGDAGLGKSARRRPALVTRGTGRPLALRSQRRRRRRQRTERVAAGWKAATDQWPTRRSRRIATFHGSVASSRELTRASPDFTSNPRESPKEGTWLISSTPMLRTSVVAVATLAAGLAGTATATTAEAVRQHPEPRRRKRRKRFTNQE